MNMSAEELTGVYTYRSMLNRPEPVGDFNKIRFAEALGTGAGSAEDVPAAAKPTAPEWSL
jgi:hypothetical protein